MKTRLDDEDTLRLREPSTFFALAVRESRVPSAACWGVSSKLRPQGTPSGLRQFRSVQAGYTFFGRKNSTPEALLSQM